jgi:hypothetical protein
MSLIKRAAHGALSGFGGTLALTGLRKALAAAGIVGTTAPEQVVGKLEELGLLDEWSSQARRVLTVAAHVGYGVGVGAALGLVRRERGEAGEEAAVGSALGLLVWGANWSSLLPLAGVHRPPWKERTPKVLLPVLDHAVYGAVWGLLNRAVSRKPV